MKDLLTPVAPLSQDELDRAVGQQGTDFGKGMRSATLGMRQGAANAMGAVGGALGYSEFAADQYQQADALGQRAAASAPRVTSMRDIGNFGDATDWAAGTLGGLVPSAAVGIGAGLLAPASAGALGAMAAGTAAYAAPEVGDVVGRQRAAGQEVNLRDATLSGLGSAALGSVVPGLVAGKLAGRALSKAPMTMSRARGQIAADAALEGGTEALGEAGKQLGSTQTLDTLDYGQIADAGAAGALGGGVMGGLGAAGEYAHQGRGAKNAATGLLDSAKAKAEGAGEAAKGAVDKAKDVGGEAGRVLEGYEIPSKLAGLWDSGAAKGRQMLNQIADSEEIVGDAKEFLTAKGEQLQAKFAENDGKRGEAIKGYVDELAQERLSPEQYERLKAATSDLSSKANQAVVAGIKRSRDAYKAASGAVERFAAAVKAHPNAQASKGVKRSEDYSAANDAVREGLIPVLQEIKPELFEGHPQDVSENMNMLADVVRRLLPEMARNKLSPEMVLEISTMFGKDAGKVFDAARSTVGMTDPKQTQALFENLNAVDEVTTEHLKIDTVQRKYLREDLQKVTTASELRTEAEMLQAWATSSKHGPGSPQRQLSDAHRAYADKNIREAMEYRYGKKGADAIFAAVEAVVTKPPGVLDKVRVKTDDDGNPLDPEDHGLDEQNMDAPSMVYYRGGPSGKDMMLHPDHDPGKGGFEGAAAQKLAKIKAKNPMTEARFVTADDLGPDHPIVKDWREQLIRRAQAADVDGERYADEELGKYVVIAHERSTSPQEVSADELQAMRLDTHKYPKSPSRLQAGEGGPILDAMRITRAMMKRFEDSNEYSPGDEQRVQRIRRMFTEGVAAVQSYLGKPFDIPDDTVILVENGHRYTWGEVRKADRRTDADKAYDATSQELDAQRKNYRTAGPTEKANLKEMAQKTLERREFAKSSELTRDEMRQQGLDEAGFEGVVERGLSRRDTHSRKGREDISTGEIVPDRLGFVEGSTTQSPQQQRINELRGDLAVLEAKLEAKTATDADRVRIKAIDYEIDELRKVSPASLGSGRKEIDPFGPTHDVMRGGDDPDAQILTNSDGSGRVTPGKAAPIQLLAEKLRASTSAPARSLGAKLEALIVLDHSVVKRGGPHTREFREYVGLPAQPTKLVVGGKVPDAKRPSGADQRPGTVTATRGRPVLSQADHDALMALSTKSKASEIAEVVNRLTEKYAQPEEQAPPMNEEPMGEPPKGTQAQAATTSAEEQQIAWINRMASKETLAESIAVINKLNQTQLEAMTNQMEDLSGPPEGVTRARWRQLLGHAQERAYNQEGAPDPKAVAAKKAALSEKARSGDPELLKALASSTDAKGLQRAVDHLASGKVDMATAAAIRTANERLAELVRGSADVAYGLGTKRYSMMGFQLHQENQYQGFPATHDSPIRHEGKFDWRAHKGKGEGNAMFGAGTYLSTAEGTHKGYKKQFTARAEREGPLSDEAKQLREALDENSDTIIFLQQSRDQDGPWRANVGGRFDHFQSQEEAQSAVDKRRKERLDRIAELEKMLVDKVNPEGKEYNLRYIRDEALPYVREKLREEAGGKPEKMQDLIDKATEDGRAMLSRLQEIEEKDRFGSTAPTYEVSVDIPQDRLLDWNKPLSEQSEFVRTALLTDTFVDEALFQYANNPGGERGTEQHTGAEVYNSLATSFERQDKTPLRDRASKNYKPINGQAKASDYLQSLGILGNVHDAQFGSEKKFRNYVIYDDSKITTNYVHFSLMRNTRPNAYQVGSFGEMEIVKRGDRWGFRHPESGEALELGEEFHERGATYEDGDLDRAGTYSTKERAKAALQQANDADSAYAYSRQRVTPNASGPINRKPVYEYMQRVFGPRIAIAWKNFLHAGEFERVVDPQGGWEDVIRLSVHSLNPMSPAYHEALHGFFAKLRDLKQGQIMDVIERAANSAPVMNQLRKLLANEPDALKQLSDPEERAAYMYQFWASDDLTIGDQTKTVFGKIADFIRSVLGIWSNDERALHILDYFHQGDFAKDLGGRNARDVVEMRAMGPGHNRAVEQAKKMTQPLRELGEALGVAGAQRLRDTGIPALRELADVMKLHGTAEGDDPGYMPAARREHSMRMNKLAKNLRDVSGQGLRAALESLQSKSNAAIDALPAAEQAAARAAKVTLRKHLDDTFDYMQANGVRVSDLGYGKDYFPRVYDAAYVSSHQAEFKAVLARHGVSDTQAVANKLMVTGGAEFTVEVDKPGMQNLKPRKLAHIPDDELAPFMRKDALEIISSYTMQATRRAEWAVRFGDDGKRIEQLLAQAKREGATDSDLDAARKFVRSVDGTLGDSINPEARRLMGNMIVYQNIRLLPLAIFSSVVDPMGVMVRGGTVGDAFKTFKRGVRETIKAYKRTATDDDMTKLAADIGTIDDSMLAHTMSAIYMQGMAGDTARKINDTFFRFNLMEQWNASMRVGATEAAIGFLKRHADGTASPHSVRWLAELGLQPGQIKGDVDVNDPQIKAAINRWVDGAVLRPDAADKPIWMSDPHWALVAHLKQFVFSFHETILKRVAHEYKHGNYAPAMTLASYVPAMMAADMIKGLIQGGGDEPEWKRTWGPADYVWSGVERAGLLGTGQFAVDAVGNGVGSLAGPSLEQLGSAVQALGGHREFAPLMIKSMPANALYSGFLGTTPEDPRTTG